MFLDGLKEIVRKIALIKIGQAETFISGAKQGDFKLEYVVNLVIEELKKLPLPVYIRILLVIFQFAVKSELRKEVQKVFDEIKEETNKI